MLAGNRFIGPSFWLLQPRLSVSVIISVSPSPPPRKELAILDAVKPSYLVLIVFLPLFEAYFGIVASMQTQIILGFDAGVI